MGLRAWVKRKAKKARKELEKTGRKIKHGVEDAVDLGKTAVDKLDNLARSAYMSVISDIRNLGRKVGREVEGSVKKVGRDIEDGVRKAGRKVENEVVDNVERAGREGDWRA